MNKCFPIILIWRATFDIWILQPESCEFERFCSKLAKVGIVYEERLCYSTLWYILSLHIFGKTHYLYRFACSLIFAIYFVLFVKRKNVNCQSAKLPVVAIQGHLEHPPLYLLCYLLLVNCIEGLLLDFIKLVFFKLLNVYRVVY